MVVLISSYFESLFDEEKKPYYEMAKNDKDRYERERVALGIENKRTYDGFERSNKYQHLHKELKSTHISYQQAVIKKFINEYPHYNYRQLIMVISSAFIKSSDEEREQINELVMEEKKRFDADKINCCFLTKMSCYGTRTLVDFQYVMDKMKLLNLSGSVSISRLSASKQCVDNE